MVILSVFFNAEFNESILKPESMKLEDVEKIDIFSRKIQ